MLKLRQFYTLSVQELDDEDLPLQYHSQNYYELVFIQKGSGMHLINQTSVPYKAGDLFVVSLEDTHHFETKSKTKITAIKFTDGYFRNSQQKDFSNDIGFNPLDLMNNAILKEIKLEFDLEERIILKQIVNNIVLYSKKKEVSSSQIIFFQILSIFGIISEAMDKMSLSAKNDGPIKEKMTHYIHKNIYNPKEITVAQIASHFNISTKYFSSYFKRKFDISLRGYINNYRLRLIEQRLEAGRTSIREIADEFNFNDESHFSHYYKNNRGFSPTAYINQHNKSRRS